MKRKVIAVFTACIISVSLLSACGHQSDEPAGGQEHETPDWSVASPDNSLSVDILLDNGQLYFWVEKDDSIAVKKSMLGISTDTNLFNDLTFIQSDNEEKTISYTNITGKKKDVTTSFNGTTLTFSEGDFYLDAEFRAYNDGYAFRYGIRHVNDETGTFTIEDENTHFVLPDDAKTYGMKYVSNPGVLGNGEYYSYEEKYQYMSYNNLSSEQLGFPLMYYYENAEGEEVYSLLMESDIYGHDYHGSFLEKDGSYGLKTIHSPASGSQASLEAAYPFTSPWRVGIVGGLDTLVESTLVEDVYDETEYWKPDNYDTLSDEEKKIYDYEWVLPGCGAWSYLNYDSEATKHSSQRDWEEQKKYVDAIANLEWPWLVLDAGWNEGGFNEAEFKEFVQYANAKGVHIMVWADSFASMYTRAATGVRLDQWKSWGIEGIKVDFFDGQGVPYMSEKWKLNSQQSLDDHYEMIYQEAAKRQMVVDCHGCNIPTGERRKYPNVINREAIRGYEFKNVDAGQTVILPFTRGTIGPNDFTPAIIPYLSGTVTVGHNMGLAVTLESGMPTFSDIPEHYSSENVWFDFYKSLPAVWDDTKLVSAELGDYVVIARRSGDKWYIGCNATSAKSIEINLSFLQAGNYNANIWKDGAAYNAVVKEEKTVTNASTLSIDVAKNGGFAIIIEN